MVSKFTVLRHLDEMQFMVYRPYVKWVAHYGKKQHEILSILIWGNRKGLYFLGQQSLHLKNLNK